MKGFPESGTGRGLMMPWTSIEIAVAGWAIAVALWFAD